MLVTTWLSKIEYHLRPIWLQILVVINSESLLTLFPSFCTKPSEVAVLFNSNLSRSPFFGHVVSNMLLCTGFHLEQENLFLCYIFTERPMTDRKIEPSNGCYFGQQQPLKFSFHMKKKPVPLKFSFHMKKKITGCSQKIKKH